MGAIDSEIVRKAEAILASAKAFDGDRVDRYELMKQVDLLYLELENPMESMFRQWTFNNMAASLNMMVRFDIFEKMPRQGSITAKELASIVNLDQNVIARFMRILTATGIVALKGDETYAHTPKSLAYLKENAADFFGLCMNMMKTFLSFPDYFKSKTPEELIDLRKTPYSFAYDSEGLTFYETLSLKADTLNMFNKAMMQQESTLPTLGMFPFTSLRQEIESEPERAFVVDIGGGRGQSLLLIQKETANAFGTNAQMVLQDRPQVLDTIPQELVPGIDKMAYDFYTEQPVKNAHIYYLRRITHNYQDGVCIAILKRIAEAMGPKSRLLIAEIVVPDRTEVGEDMGTYNMDVVMLAIGGKERNEKEFKDLLDAAGLELTKVWTAAVGKQCVVEARLKRDS